MLIRSKDLPQKHTTWNNKLDTSTERYPFFLKEMGYCNERKIEFGNKYSFNDILILYSYSGVVRYSKSSTTHYIQPHHVIITACNAPLIFTRTSKDWEFFYIIIRGSHAKLYYNLIRTKDSTIAINPLTSTLNHFIDLINVPYIDDDFSSMEHSVLVHSILFELYKATYDISKARMHTPIQETDVNSAITYISNNYMKELSIDDICNEVNLSKYYFCKIFKEYSGISIHKYLNEYRINKSKELLSYSKLTITSIAIEVGFNNSLTYIRCFKQSTKMTPSEYRKYF